MNRRKFISKTILSGAAVTMAPSVSFAGEKDEIRIVGVSCSPRKGMTTATAVKVALDEAQKVDQRITTIMVDLGGLEFSGWVGGAKPDEAQIIEDDFNFVLPMIHNPVPDGLIIGSPVYFRSMSALCKAFLERLAVLRTSKLLLADRPCGALAVGSYRNGGQELVIEQIQTAMLCHEMLLVGGKPPAHQGATLWNAFNDDIMKDELGIVSAKKLGARIAEAALKLKINKND